MTTSFLLEWRPRFLAAAATPLNTRQPPYGRWVQAAAGLPAGGAARRRGRGRGGRREDEAFPERKPLTHHSGQVKLHMNFQCA